MLDDADPGRRDGDADDLVADERAQGHAEDGAQGEVGEGAGEDEPDVMVAEREGPPSRPGAVFWPTADDPLFRLVGDFPFPSSDHRLVWIDVAVPGGPPR